MKLKKGEATKAFIQAGGNVGKAMVIYIAKNGCSGFRCRSCVLKVVCSHHRNEASSYAIRTLVAVEEKEGEIARAKKLLGEDKHEQGS